MMTEFETALEVAQRLLLEFDWGGDMHLAVVRTHEAGGVTRSPEVVPISDSRRTSAA